jgi:hypothetical protein
MLPCHHQRLSRCSNSQSKTKAGRAGKVQWVVQMLGSHLPWLELTALAVE